MIISALFRYSRIIEVKWPRSDCLKTVCLMAGTRVTEWSSRARNVSRSVFWTVRDSKAFAKGGTKTKRPRASNAEGE